MSHTNPNIWEHQTTEFVDNVFKASNEVGVRQINLAYTRKLDNCAHGGELRPREN